MERIKRSIFCKVLTAALFASAILTLSNVSARAQHGYRVEKTLKFAKGKTSAIIKGRIGDEQETREYKFKARAGQRLSVRIAARNSDLRFMILDGSDAPVGSGALKTFDWTGELPASGRYRILVYSLSGKGAYALTVEIK